MPDEKTVLDVSPSLAARTLKWFCLLLLLAAMACRSVPAPPPVPSIVDERGESERDKWLQRRLLEADGTIRADASVRAARSWQAWTAKHAPAGLQEKAASPLGARTWQEAGPRNIAGRVLSVAFDPTDPDVLWAGTAGGGLWRSEDFGQTWKQIGGDHFPSLWIGALAVDPRDPQTLYVGTGDTDHVLVAASLGSLGALLKTVDGGRTFTRLPLPEAAFFRTVVSPTDSNAVLTSGPTGLYRSPDAGAHFTKTLEGKITDFAFDPKNPARILAVRGASSFDSPDNGLFESLDSGVTWHPFGGQVPYAFGGWGRSSISFAPAPSKALYLAVSLFQGPTSSFIRSLDDGKTWELVAANNTQGYRGVDPYGAGLAVSPVSESRLLQVNGYSILISRDGGLHWDKPGGDWHLDTHSVAFHPLFPERVVIATDGGVAVSRDSGSTFWKADLGFPTVQLYTCAVGLWNPASFFGGTQDNWMTIYRGDPGRAWDFSYPPVLGDITAISVHPTRTQEILAVTAAAEGIGLSLDEGRKWERTDEQGIAVDELSPWLARMVRSPRHPDQIYLGGRYLDVSSDGGRSWKSIVVRPVDNRFFQIADLALSPADDAEIWTVWEDNKVLVSQDGGANWQDRTPPGGGSRAGVRISAGPVQGTAYVALSGTTGARLFRTHDGGATWDDISRDLPELPLNAVLADPRVAGRLFVATDAGVVLSVDDGNTWHDASGSLPSTPVLDLCLDPASGRLAAATFGRGLWELKSPPPCQADATTLCLNGGRFEVRSHWTTATGSGEGKAVPLTADTGYFYFFDPANVEALVKVIDGCVLNNSFWTFAGGLTNVQTTLTLRDTLTGDVKTYTNPQGTPFQPIQDVGTFPNCDVLKAAPADALAAVTGRSVAGTSLLLNQERFKVDVTWETPDGKTGQGTPVALTSDTGYFWFFDPANVEMVVKVLDGCALDQSYWVFVGGLTDVRTVLTVTDTVTGKTKTYVNPQKAAFQPIQDVTAFPACP